MNVAERKAMRREQIERWLATSDMSVEEWCKLNRMSTSTFYLWLNKFRDEDPATFGHRPAPGWVEVARESRKGSVVSVNIFFTISTNIFSPIAPPLFRRPRQRGCAASG